MIDRLRVLELFCGIGGCAAAVGERGDVVAAVDQNLAALAVYSQNFRHTVVSRTVESIAVDELRAWDADLWWLSPPCQPYTQRGLRRDVDDSRAASLLIVIERIRDIRPRYVALENVPAFQGSRAHARFREMLASCGYDVRERVLCPTELGVPNRRRRFYLVAGRTELWPWPEWRSPAFRVSDILDEHPSDKLWLPAPLVEKYREALRLVDARDPAAETVCFTAAYGRSPVRSGSYLVTDRGVRRFSPAEILRLLCFPPQFSLPVDLPSRKAWPLIGNSLSVRAVQFVLAAIPDLATLT